MSASELPNIRTTLKRLRGLLEAVEEQHYQLSTVTRIVRPDRTPAPVRKIGSYSR